MKNNRLVRFAIIASSSVLLVTLVLKFFEDRNAAHGKALSEDIDPTATQPKSIAAFNPLDATAISPRDLKIKKILVGTQVKANGELVPLIENTMTNTPFVYQGAPPAAALENGKPVLNFDGQGFIHFEMLTKQQMGVGNHLTFVAVYKPAADLKLGDLFSWGDCGVDRFLMHGIAEDGKTLVQQMGSPSHNPLQFLISEKTKKSFIVYSLLQDGPDVEVYLNQRHFTFPGLWPSDSVLDSQKPLSIGRSGCGNQFVGQVAEIFYTGEKLDAKTISGILKYYTTQFGE